MASVDASNSCIPPSHPLLVLGPPLPSTTRGESCVVSGKGGRFHQDSHSVLLYGSGKSVVVQYLDDDQHHQSFVYRGHVHPVTAAQFAPSGCYVASGDSRGKLRVWAYDNPQHFCKLELQLFTGPIRDIAWDAEGKRIAVVGERMDASSDCAKVVQWDTGVTCGELTQHARGRAVSCDMKPNRPMRLVTSGMDDSRVVFHAGPPFKRIMDGTPTEGAHVKGAVNCVRYNAAGDKVASVGADKMVVIYDGKTGTKLANLEQVHEGTIYACAWSPNDKFLLTCSADGTVKLLSVEPLEIVHTWNVAELQIGAQILEKTPIGGMQVGCAFVGGDVPVSVGLNGQLTMLPKPPMLESGIDTLKILTGHSAPIAGLAIGLNGLFYTGDTDGVVCQWNMETGKAIKRIQPPESTDMLGKMHGDAVISSLACNCTGALLTAGWDDTVRVIDKTNDVVGTIALEAQPHAMSCGTQLTAVLTVSGIVLVKDGAKVSPGVLSLKASGLSIAMSKDDSTLYVGGQDCKIYVYTVLSDFTLNPKHEINNGHLKPVHALALSHDQTKLASADVRDVCVWSLEDGIYSSIVGKSRWCFHTQRITCLSWSADDTVLATGGADDSIYLWSLANKTKRLHYNFAHRGGVTGIAFLKGFKLLSVGVDACVNQWDMADDVAKKFA